MIKTCRLFVAVMLGEIIGAGNLSAEGEKPADWSAQWIGPARSGTNLWTCYRKAFSIRKAPSCVPARIAVDSKYWLWVNGRRVVSEGGLKRGPTPEGTYFDEVDLAPYLVRGSNEVALLSWYFGKHGFSHKSSGRAGMVFEARWNDGALLSDASWKMIAHPAFGTASGPNPNYRLPESSLRFDARKEMPGWTEPGFDDSRWETPTLGGIPPAGPWGTLEKRPIPFWKDGGLRDYAGVCNLPVVSDGKAIVAKLPYNAHVTPYFEIDAPAGLTVDLRTDNFMGGSAPNVHEEYVTRAGVQAYEAWGWMNGHDVRYTFPAGVRVVALKYRETGFAAGFAGAFQCDDSGLNTLWEKARRTLYVTMRDNYMDCPDRERAQWWGDVVNELGEVFYALDPAGASLTRKAILELARWQRPDKTIYSPVPSGNWFAELPPQMLASVGKYGFWTYYFYTADAETVRTVYPCVRDYLRLWTFGPDGLLAHRKGGWDWSDWGANIDVPVLDNAWYRLALEGAVNMAKLVGEDADADDWGQRMKTIDKSFNAAFWSGKEYRSPKYAGDTDDRANALAVVAGLAAPEQYPALRQVLAEHFNASPYMEKYVLESLFLMGAPEQAQERMKTRWKKQIDSPLTTLWEGWGLGAEGFGGGTYNHAWSGGALTVLSQYVAGVAPLKPGYEVYQVRPQMGGLRKVASSVATVKGPIKLSLERDGTVFRMGLESPRGTCARIALPKQAGHPIAALRVNGRQKKDFCKGKICRGVTFLCQDDGYVWLEVKPGSWRFEAETP